MMNDTFGGRVAWLRSLIQDPDPELKMRELDTLAGLHHGHVWQIERGHRENTTRETVRGLADVFGCHVGWLMEGEGEAPSPEAVRAAVGVARATHEAERVSERTAAARVA